MNFQHLRRQQRDMYLDIMDRWHRFFADLPPQVAEVFGPKINEIALDYCESPEFIAFLKRKENCDD